MIRTPAFLFVALAACQTDNHSTARVDPALLEYVNENGRNQIAEARRARDEAADAVAAAERRAEQSRRELEVEQASRRVEEAKLQKADTEQRVDRQAAGVEGDGSGNRAGDGTSARGASVHDARAGVQVADDRIAWRKEGITAADREVDLAKAKLELARARVALAEAEALRNTDRPEADRIDLVAIERDRRARETEVDVAKVRLEAAQRECDLAKRCVDETPAQREERMRRLERRPDAPPVNPTDPRPDR